MENGRAIVIGASSGIGRCVAQRFIQGGWTVGVAARRTELMADLGAKVVAEIDVTAEDSPQRLQKLITDLGGMDLFFYAAGVGRQNLELAESVELQTVETNGMGFTRMVGEAYRWMVQEGKGHIACISSIAGTKGLGMAPSYSATKAFQNCYLEALQQQARMRGAKVFITDIRPGFVDTPLLHHTCPLMMQPDDVAKKIVRAIKKRRAVVVIDGRWRLITWLWRLIPHCLWRRMRVGK